MFKPAKSANKDVEIWSLLPIELIVKITEHFVGYSQLRLFRTLCKQTSTMTTPLHERCIRIRNQIQLCIDTSSVLPTRPPQRLITCSCGFINTPPLQLTIAEFECSNWMCRKKTLPTPEPPLMKVNGIHGIENTPESIMLNANLEQNKFSKYQLVEYRWRTRAPGSSVYSQWNICLNSTNPFINARKSKRDPDLLYSFCMRVKSDTCTSSWSVPSHEVHPLTQSEVSVMDKKKLGYFAL